MESLLSPRLMHLNRFENYCRLYFPKWHDETHYSLCVSSSLDNERKP